MSKIIHGTSIHRALMLIENSVKNELNQEKIYFFDGERKEAYAGALAFATGDGLRSINNAFNLSFINSYIALNDNFPKGVFGQVFKILLKSAVKAWKKKQEELKINENDNIAAIVECEKIDELVSINRKNIVFESYIEKKNFNKIKVLAIYVDQMHREEVKNFLRKINSSVEVKKIEDLVNKDYEKGSKPSKIGNSY